MTQYNSLPSCNKQLLQNPCLEGLTSSRHDYCYHIYDKFEKEFEETLAMFDALLVDTSDGSTDNYKIAIKFLLSGLSTKISTSIIPSFIIKLIFISFQNFQMRVFLIRNPPIPFTSMNCLEKRRS